MLGEAGRPQGRGPRPFHVAPAFCAGAGTLDPPAEFFRHQAGSRREASCQEPVQLSH